MLANKVQQKIRDMILSNFTKSCIVPVVYIKKKSNVI